MNQILAWAIVVPLLVYFAVELGWGGGSTQDYAAYRRQRDPLWPRWRWKPPEPRDEDPDEPKPDVPKIKTPEMV